MKKLLSVMLAVCMVLTLAFAAGSTAAAECAHENTKPLELYNGICAFRCLDCGGWTTHKYGTDENCPFCNCKHEKLHIFSSAENHSVFCEFCREHLGQHPHGTDENCIACNCTEHVPCVKIIYTNVHEFRCKTCGLDLGGTHGAGESEDCAACACDHALEWTEEDGNHVQTCACGGVTGEVHAVEECGPDCSFYVEPVEMSVEEAYIAYLKTQRAVAISNAATPAVVETGVEQTFTARGEIYADEVHLNSLQIDPTNGFTNLLCRYIEMSKEDVVIDGSTVTLTEKLLNSLAEGKYLLTVTSAAGCQFFMIEK